MIEVCRLRNSCIWDKTDLSTLIPSSDKVCSVRGPSRSNIQLVTSILISLNMLHSSSLNWSNQSYCWIFFKIIYIDLVLPRSYSQVLVVWAKNKLTNTAFIIILFDNFKRLHAENPDLWLPPEGKILRIRWKSDFNDGLIERCICASFIIFDDLLSLIVI